MLNVTKFGDSIGNNFVKIANLRLGKITSYTLISLLLISLTPKTTLANQDICIIIRNSYNITRQSLLELQSLLKKKIDLNQLSCHSGRSLLNFAYKSPGTSNFISDIRPGRYDAIVQLLNHGADVREVDFNGSTPLHIVAKTGDINLIYLYLEAGADINAQDNNGKTPLKKAILANSETVNLLLHLGADPAIGNPLAEAIYFKQVKALKILLQHGVKPPTELLEKTYKDFGVNSKDYRERKIITLLNKYQNVAKDRDNSDFFNPPPPHPPQLLPSLEDPPIVIATRNNNLVKVRRLIAKGVDVDIVSEHEPFGSDEYTATATSLHIAIAKGYNEMQKL